MHSGKMYMPPFFVMVNCKMAIIITLAGIVTYFAGYNEQISGLKIHFSPPNLELFTSAGHCFKLALGK